jgi:hypothetical protein
VAQGLSAAQQLLDFDDDQMDMDFQQPITPARPQVRPSPRQYTPSTPSQQGSSAYRTPRNPSGSGRTHQVWEDSPQAMTPKVLKRLEGRNTERNWWAQRRERELGIGKVLEHY